MNHPKWVFSCLAIAVLQVACTTAPHQQIYGRKTAGTDEANWQNGILLDAEGKPVATSNSTAAEPKEERLETEPKVRIYEGSGVLINAPRPGVSLVGSAGEFNFEDAPIAEVVHVVLGEVLKVDYVLHQPISGTLTLTTKKAISKDQAVSLLETALLTNGLVMAQDSRGFYHVGRPEALQGIVPAPRVAGNGPLPPGYGAVLIPLEYIGAAEMAEILQPVLQGGTLVRVDSVRNMLVLSGTRTQAEGWLKLVETFDVDMLKGMSVGIFPLKYASVQDIQSAMQAVAGVGAAGGASGASPAPGQVAPGGSAAAQGGSPQQRAAAARAAAAAQQGAGGINNNAAAIASPQTMPFLGSVKILPLERLNSVMVVATRPSHLEQMREWIERLDQPNDSTEPQLFVYGVQNGSATHLAQVLSGIFGGTVTGAGGSSTNSGVAPGLNSSSGFSGGFNSNSNTGFNSNNSNRFGGGGGLGSNGLSSSNGSQNQQAIDTSPVAMDLNGMRVIADPLNNAILVWGSRQEYKKIEATLKRLDKQPVQVILEASIVEVTLTNELQYGLRWAFSGGVGNSGYNGTGGAPALNGTTITPATAASQSLGDALGSFTYALTSGDKVRGLLQMLASRSLVKMLSSPSLLVLDNHTASITVGDQIPVVTSTTYYQNSSGTSSNSVQYRDTGLILSVTPSVNSGDMVTLAVDQSVVSEGAAVASASGNPKFMQRQITSKVAVRSGQPVVLGGLIRENTNNSKDGIPGLVDVPVLGNAFGGTSNRNDRTELLVVITPTVVRSGDELKEAGDELRNRMQELLRTRVEEISKGGPVLPGEEEIADFVRELKTAPVRNGAEVTPVSN